MEKDGVNVPKIFTVRQERKTIVPARIRYSFVFNRVCLISIGIAGNSNGGSLSASVDGFVFVAIKNAWMIPMTIHKR